MRNRLTPFPARPATQVLASGAVKRGGSAGSRFLLGERAVISRALCHFERMPAPPGERGPQQARAAMLAAKARSPLLDPQFFLDWGEDDIGVWSWPRGAITGLSDFEGECVPESVFHAPGVGPRLVEVSEGYEGEVWEGGRLLATRWWSNPPTDAQWRDFLRASRQDPDVSAPVPRAAPMRADPPASPWMARLVSLQAPRQRDITAAVIALLAAPIAYFALQWAAVTFEQARLAAKLETLSEAAGEITAAQGEARTALDELRDYEGALDRQHPIELLAVLTGLLSDAGVDLREFAMRGDDLSVALFAEGEFAPADLVRSLEADDLMYDVLAEPGRLPGEWRIQAQVVQP